VPTYQVKICFAISRNTVEKKAPVSAWDILTLIFGKKIYVTVMVKRTMRKGTTYRMRTAVIRPNRNSGKNSLNVLRSGIRVVAMNDIKSIMIIKVIIINEKMNDRKKVLFFFTSKITFRALSIDANT
jgi:hypothetical protein